MDLTKNNSPFEQKANDFIKGKDQLAFYNVESIYDQLLVFNMVVANENIEDSSKNLIEQAIWIYNLSYYYEYNQPSLGSESIIAKWTKNPDEKIQLTSLISSISSDKKNSIEEKVLHDTIYSYLSDKKLEQHLAALQLDDQKHGQFTVLEEWLKTKFDQLRNLRFYTDSAHEMLAKRKRKNFGRIEKMLKKLDKQRDLLIQDDLNIDANELKSLKKKLRGVEGRSERGVETMFRLASKNLYTRARILDSKSSILITVNSIILSVVLGTLYSQIVEDPHLIIPVSILFLTNLTSIGYSIIASRPELKKGKFLREDVENKKASLLNFDDYHAVSIEDYVWAMDQAANDADYLYHTIVWDLHNMGKRMHKKYRNLKIAYNIFLFGLIVSIVLFMGCHFFLDWN